MESPEHQLNSIESDYEIHLSDAPELTRNNSELFRFGILFVLGIVIGIFIWIGILSRAPVDFHPDTVITVYSGMTIKDLASVLEHSRVIKSDKWFHVIMSSRWKGKPIITGDYMFEKPQSVFTVAYRLVRGIYGNSRIKITLPEGITRYDMADIVSQKIPTFPRDEFLQKTHDLEGFLFPDTYYFFRTQSVDQIITSLRTQWQQRMKSFSDSFVQTELFDTKTLTTQTYGGKSRTVQDIITMASILEREANNPDEAKTVAGILWKRMSKNMPLQVDATFKYTIGKTSADLTITDLQKDNPYNTYTRTGLPVGPIGNPGQDMIDAALYPIESEYWYYLHDDQGIIHYAKNYQEHLKNKEKYIK